MTILSLLMMLSVTVIADYAPDWESLSKHEAAPEWFQDAKLGIYFHWGAYSVPAFGSEWYPRYMFLKDNWVSRHHLEKYGDPGEYGYDRFVDQWQTPNFDAEEWAELFKRAGARFAGPVAEHHDGLALWDSTVTPWDTVEKGPKRDLVGELAKAIRGEDMKYITTMHHARNHYGHYDGVKNNYPQAIKDDDMAILYGQMPSEEFHEFWLTKLKELIDQYQPDIIWFDSWLDRIPEDYRQAFSAYYLNAAKKWDKDVVIVRKQNDLPINMSVLDHEKARESKASKHVWMTDDTISTGSWCYTNSLEIKPTSKVVHALIDTVAKNGVVLLNISPKADGTIPQDQRQVLHELGDWLKINGEAIYATRPWKAFGEGPTVEPTGGFSEHRKFLKLEYSEQDIRYTQSKDGKTVYAITMGWPQAKTTLASVKVIKTSPKAKISMIGRPGTLKYHIDKFDRLVVDVPQGDKAKHAGDFAYSLKLEGFTLDAVEKTTLAPGYPETARSKQCINQGWQYHLGDVSGAEKANFNDSRWETVHVPHTLTLADQTLNGYKDDKTQPTFHRHIAWYRRTIVVSENPGKVFLEFEGAHQVTDAWINGQYVGQHAIGGYTPFHFDVTDYVKPGKNVVALRLDNRRRDDIPPDPGPFDYIKFSGLYRDVYLVETDPLHVTFPWEDFYAGVFVTTPTVDVLNQNATVAVRTTVRNEKNQARDCSLYTRIIDRDGNVVIRLRDQVTIAAGADHTFNQCGGIEEDLHLWSIEDPYLYRVNTLVYDGDVAVDCMETNLGIRSIELNKHDGFLLNGKPVKMIGDNRHQHYAYIGDALPNSLHVKDIMQFKELGFNTIRTAHYPHDNALLEACDRLGVLVYEEPPTWISIGNDAWFDNLEKAARRMVRNHRNHPSVVIWGAGINHRGYVPRLHYAVKQEDPTRWTASNNSEWTGLQASGVCDLFTNMDYSGIKDWSGKEYLFGMEGRSHARSVSKYKSNPLRIGITGWTAHAYYTFHGNRGGYMRSGKMDGFRTPPYVKGYKGWMSTEETSDPIVVIGDDWKQGIKDFRVYSNCEEVELSLDGKVLARLKPNEDSSLENLNHPGFVYEVKNFKPGEIVAKGLINGEVKTSDQIRTPGNPVAVHLNLDMDGRELMADGSDIVMAYARVVDEHGTFIRDAKMEVAFSVTGPASIVGDKIIPQANPMQMTRNGSAPAMIRAGLQTGTITVRAEVPGLKAAEAQVTSVSFNNNVTVAESKPIYDLERVRVDIGEEGQLVQFDWIPWNGASENETIELPQLGGFSATLKTGSDEGIARWLGEMNVKGFQGFAMGEGVCVIDSEGLVLEFSGLVPGKYKLTTYHHAPSSNTNSMDPNRERLKTLTIHKIPVAEQLVIESKDRRGRNRKQTVAISSGKVLPDSGPGKAVIELNVNNTNPVKVRIKDAIGSNGIWINGFELKQAR